MPKIALSYRRSDSSAITGRICDRLIARYGKKSVFIDIDNIPYGVDFMEQLRSEVEESERHSLARGHLIATISPISRLCVELSAECARQSPALNLSRSRFSSRAGAASRATSVPQAFVSCHMNSFLCRTYRNRMMWPV